MLKQRILTAIIALVVLGIVLYVLPFAVATLVIAGVILAGAWEWSGFLGLSGSGARIAYVVLIGALLYIAATFGVPYRENLIQIACGWWLLAFIWTFFYPTAIPNAVRWVCGALVLVPLGVILPQLLKHGPDLLLFVLLIVWAADIGAYFAGKQFGRVKLAPSISPGKTWEGVIGGMVVVAVVAFAGSRYFGADALVLMPFCLGVAAISIVGDLTVSMFKRTAGVKDSGSLFPGHGGVLDRVDSISAATPVFMLGLGWLDLAQRVAL